MKQQAQILTSILLLTTAIGCQTETGQRSYQPAVSPVAMPARDLKQEAAIRSSAKHYTDGQPIPGVGTAIGDVYILPDGRCFGGEGTCGIQWTSGSQMMFGADITARTPMWGLIQAGSPATK